MRGFFCIYICLSLWEIPPNFANGFNNQTSIMETKKIQILKEVVRDVLIIIGMAVVVVAPIAFVLFVMWVQQIVCG